ncbi:aspartate-semialdehyde dehydrogenase [Picrophilus oshimae]|uniref:Aspartate semialdehyde dehydrogenase n=1 Tax=Picrophilus torridus (strain ATCC 700027 / DSM 9790 / JCM 10055 / NBRC 100828 / KAW 2/3) TaxID=1122961 RepID=A0A8G2L835_PICTO|nr:aspartate-semialdehyde dehydrogenase [Picrophilus oshimae]SMD30975.1 aspartate semialdehyde dehydrogenase [Picrophilus oshimae DSM 9789]
MSKIRVSLLGSTGMVGQKMVRLLENHPYIELAKVSASPNNTGKRYIDAVRWVENSEIPEYVSDMNLVSSDPNDHRDVDFVLSALPSEIAEGIETRLVSNGINVISNASPLRMRSDIPLINPEINYEHLYMLEDRDTKYVKNPNCTTTIMSMPLFDIINSDYERMYLTTMQAVSGAGFSGLPYMAINNNIIPYINGEEEKIPAEISKIFGYRNDDKIVNRNIKMSVTTVRVPVAVDHAGVLYINIKNFDIENFIKDIRNFKPLSRFSGLTMAPRQPIIIHEKNDAPQVHDVSGMEIHIGRLSYNDDTLRMYILGDNLIRGAAGITILTLELMHAMKLDN